MATYSMPKVARENPADNRLLKFTGWDDEIYFMHLEDGHFYDIEKRCACHKLFGIISPTNRKASNCYAEPSGTHTHQIPSQTDVVIFTINWACKLEAIRHCNTEEMTDEKIISNVVSTWPHDLSALLPEIKSTCSSTIQKYRRKAKDKNASVCKISSSKDQDEFTRFREVIVKLQPNWPQPIPDPVCPGDRILAEFDQVNKMFHDLKDRDWRRGIFRRWFSDFGSNLHGYHNYLEECLEKSKKSVVNRDTNILKIVKIAEKHLIFYQRCLRWKQSELEIEQIIADARDQALIISKSMPNKSESVSQNPNVSITILLLRLPSLSDWSKRIFEKMSKFFNDLDRSRIPDADKRDDVPWHTIEKNRKQVLDKVRDLQSQWHRNRKNPSYEHVRFRIAFMGKSIERNNFFSVHKNGLQQPKKMDQLPGSPTKFRISKSNSKPCEPGKICARLDWEYECQEYLSEFVVQFRLKNSNSWENKITEETFYELRIFKSGQIVEFRVAAETCFGRGKFTDIIDTELLQRNEESEEENEQVADVDNQSTDSTPEAPSAKKQKLILQPPTDLEILSVTENMVKVKWTCVSNNLDHFYHHVQCWESGEENFTTDIDVDSSQNECCVDQLEPETTYFIRVRVISEDRQHSSSFSQIISLTTLAKKLRFAEILVKKCNKIGQSNWKDIFAVPLLKSAESSSASKLERYTFGEQVHGKQRKTILLMDATGSARIGAYKTFFINAMINYIFNVKIEDLFRFQFDQKSHFNIYEINHAIGLNIPYSLTIIDTPSFDTSNDDWMNDMSRLLLMEDIQELDMIAIVADYDNPILDVKESKLFSIFGQDLEDNIRMLYSKSRPNNVHELPIVTYVYRARFPYLTDPDSFFEDFLTSLATIETKSLAMTKKMLQLKTQLASIEEGLQTLIRIGDVTKFEIKKNEEIVAECQALIDSHPYVTLEVDSVQEVRLPIGQLATNCIKCCVTCCNPCRIKDESDYSSLELSNCTFCPGKCAWTIHSNQPFVWEITQEKQVFPSEVGKDKYFAEMEKKQSVKQTLESLKNDLIENEKSVAKQRERIQRYITRIESISLYANPLLVL